MRIIGRYRLSLLALTALLAAGCLGTLHHDAGAQTLALAPRDTVGLPLHEERPHWLLRNEPGWQAAHKARFGGDREDPALTVVRAARFADEAAAAQAVARITPAYAFRVWGRLMAAEPVLAEETLIDGTPARVLRYPRRVVGEPSAHGEGQLTVMRAGRVVYVVESAGLPVEQRDQVLTDLRAAAHAVEP